METEILVALLLKKVEEKIASLPSASRLRGPRGQRGPSGKDGKDFVFADHEETIKNWSKNFALTFNDLTAEQINSLRGPQGRDGREGRDGKDGKDFVFADHEETIKEWAKSFSLKFEDLSSDQIASLRGPKGRDGKDGKDFVFSDHEEKFSKLAEDFALKFEDLSAEQISALRGPQGRDGKNGTSFIFEAHREEIFKLVSSAIDKEKQNLKLKFADLTEEEISQLRGPRGKDGLNGKGFIFEEHEEYFKTLKPKFSDFTTEEIDRLRLKFSNLTQEEKSELKLRFEDLTDEDRLSLRGTRGQRGKPGRDGRDGIDGKDGAQGPRGLPGIAGKGIPGLSIKGDRGDAGQDGQDAPYITDIKIEQNKFNEMELVFNFSDGSEITTNSIKLPQGNNVYIAGGGGAGGGGSGTGVDGKSAYEIAVDNGFVGTEAQWLASLEGTDGTNGAPGSQYYFGSGVPNNSLYSDNDIYHNTDNGDLYKKILGAWVYQGTISGGGGGNDVVLNVPCDASVYIGAAVRMSQNSVVELNLDQWTSMSAILAMDASTYSVQAVNALANTWDNSNVFGIVEAKPTPTTCNIRVSGISGAIFLGLDIVEEYYLSDVTPGQLVEISQAPSTAGTVLVRIGQPYSQDRFYYQRGDRVLRA